MIVDYWLIKQQLRVVLVVIVVAAFVPSHGTHPVPAGKIVPRM